MYNRIENLCKEHGINITQMCRDAGIPRGNLTDLKNGRTAALSTKNLSKISSYFGVAMDILLDTQPKERAPVLNEKDKRDIARDLERMRADLENSDTLMFEGNPMSPEARESILAAVKLGLEAAKIQNKQKYTPKKYKKE